MAGFDIIRHPNYQEVQVDGDLSLSILKEIFAEIAKAENFLALHALWVFGPHVRPLAFHEFDEAIAMIDKLYMRRPTGKRVALAVPGPFARSVAEVFLAQAAKLPAQFRIFESAAKAREWIVG